MIDVNLSSVRPPTVHWHAHLSTSLQFNGLPWRAAEACHNNDYSVNRKTDDRYRNWINYEPVVCLPTRPTICCVYDAEIDDGTVTSYFLRSDYSLDWKTDVHLTRSLVSTIVRQHFNYTILYVVPFTSVTALQMNGNTSYPLYRICVYTFCLIFVFLSYKL